MSWVAVGVGLVGAVGANNAARRGSRAAQQNANQAQARVSPFLANTGYTVGVNNTGTGRAGPSFTFGGNTGAVAPVASPNFNPSATLAPGQGTAFGTDGSLRLDGSSGRIFDQNGNPVGGTPVAPGSSLLNVNLPDFSEGLGFSSGLDLSGVYSQLAGANSGLANLRDSFSLNPDDPGLLLDIANQAADLIPRVQAGASEMREARLNGINNTEASLISDLREQMNRRRTLGSSFANDDLARTRLEVEQARGNASAQSTLEELSTTSALLGFQSQLIQQSGNIILAALQQESANASNEGGLRIGEAQVRQGDAQIRLQSQRDQFNSEIAALQLAFQGQQQAHDYVNTLLQIANGATQIQQNAIQFGTNAEIDGINGLISAGINGAGAVQDALGG